MANPLYGQNKFDTQADQSLGQSLTVKADSDGSAGSPTTTLTASESGNVYFVDISANTYAFKLPAVADNAGVRFTFILSAASDAEATKDFIITTAAAADDIIGVGLDAGAVHDAGTGNSTLTFDTSAGAAAGGDRVSLICDGLDWYILDCVALSANALVSS